MYLFGFQRICSDSKEDIKKARRTHIEGRGLADINARWPDKRKKRRNGVFLGTNYSKEEEMAFKNEMA